MKCPACKGDVPTGYKGRTCPSCSEALPTTQATYIEWAIRAAGFTEDRGFFFWLFFFAFLMGLFAVLEHLFGPGELAILLDQHKFVSLIMFIYVAAHLKIIRNINTVSRPGYPGRYWIDRLIIRKFKKGTNLSLLAGFLISSIVVGPLNLFSLLPAYVLIMSIFTALFWSVDSFRIDDREFHDAKVKSYFNFLGVKYIRTWRKVSGAYLIGIIVSAATFYGLMQIPDLWWLIKMNPTLNSIIELVNGLFSWIPMLYPSQ
jgi:hypothetical protein